MATKAKVAVVDASSVIKTEMKTRKVVETFKRADLKSYSFGIKNLGSIDSILGGKVEKVHDKYTKKVYEMTNLYDENGVVNGKDGKPLQVKKMKDGMPIVKETVYLLSKEEIGGLLANEIKSEIAGMTPAFLKEITSALRQSGFFSAVRASKFEAICLKAMELEEASVVMPKFNGGKAKTEEEVAIAA